MYVGQTRNVSHGDQPIHYAMYHSLRAVAFVHHGGDDHEAHSTLHRNLPKDFEDREIWSNLLSSAREYRNQADYEPYPTDWRHWQKVAKTLQGDAHRLLPISRRYTKERE